MPWFWPESNPPAGGDPTRRPQAALPLAERTVARFDPASIDVSPGRRLRVFAALICRSEAGVILAPASRGEQVVVTDRKDATYGELLDRITNDPAEAGAQKLFATFPLRIGDYGSLLRELPEGPNRTSRDPDLHPALQDLGDEISEDIREALVALDDPDAWYPGIDEGIEPVSDEHVRLVTWALQRELDRELRAAPNNTPSITPLPAAPLADLPWNVQRALAERRRWRYRQWGLGKEQWERGEWSLWDIPEDPDYVPRRAARLTPVMV
jgi:hypothetical protein